MEEADLVHVFTASYEGWANTRQSCLNYMTYPISDTHEIFRHTNDIF